jgi:subtilisin-like proprotein convertase family protein
MRSIISIFIITVVVSVLTISGLHAQDSTHYIVYSYPDQQIPPEGMPGIRDTIYFPYNINISDVNFYVQIETFYDLVGSIVVTVTSPWGEQVTLHNHNHLRDSLICWFDTEEEEDGPGDLDDYVGHNALGDWEMYVWNYASDYGHLWEVWGIEVYGESSVVLEDDEPLPFETTLGGNYPNPFNSNTVISFSLASKSHVLFDIYDVTGRLVTKLYEGELSTGEHRIKWDGTNLAGKNISSGIYFVKMIVSTGQPDGKSVFTKKLTLLR